MSLGYLDPAVFADITLDLKLRDTLLCFLERDDIARKDFYTWWENTIGQGKAANATDEQKMGMLTFAAACCFMDGKFTEAKSALASARNLEAELTSMMRLIETGLNRNAPASTMRAAIANALPAMDQKEDADDNTVDPRPMLSGPKALMAQLDDIILPHCRLDVEDGWETVVVVSVERSNRRMHAFSTTIPNDGRMTDVIESLELDDTRLIILAANTTKSAEELRVHVSEAVGQDVPESNILDIIGIKGRTWRSLMCDNATCCPPEGNTY